MEQPTPYAAYARVRPWKTHAFDMQAGRIPPTFGAFGRRAYGTDNPVIGYPLAYQYLTSLRTDALPGYRGRSAAHAGARMALQLSDRIAGASPGVPLVTAFRWDTGVQARWKTGIARGHGGGDQRDAVEPALVGRQQRQAGLGSRGIHAGGRA